MFDELFDDDVILKSSELSGEDKYQLFFNVVPECITGRATEKSLLRDYFLKRWVDYRDAVKNIENSMYMTPAEYTYSLLEGSTRKCDKKEYKKVLRICDPAFLIKAAKRAFETNNYSFRRAKYCLSDEEFSILRKTWDFVYSKPMMDFFNNRVVAEVFENGYDLQDLKIWTREYKELFREAMKKKPECSEYHPGWLSQKFLEVLFETLHKTAKRKIAMKYWAVFDTDTFNRAFEDSDIEDSLIEDAVAKAEALYRSNIHMNKTSIF